MNFLKRIMLLIGLTTALWATLPSSAYADSAQIEKVDQSKLYSLDLGLDFTKIQTNHDSSLTSVGPSARLQRNLSNHWGASVTLREGFSSSGFSAEFTSWDIDAEYAITGSQALSEEEVKVGDWNVMNSKEVSHGGFSVGAGLTQYLLTGSTSAVVFTGANLTARYVYDAGALRYLFAVHVSQVSSGSITLTPIGATLGVALWL